MTDELTRKLLDAIAALAAKVEALDKRIATLHADVRRYNGEGDRR